MLGLPLLLSSLALVHAEKLLFAQTLWRHGLRSPTNTYANDPYDAAFFGVPEGELLPEGMQQQFIRGQQLRKMYTETQPLVSTKYSRYETYVRSADYPRCSQSAIANIAGFYADSPTFPSDVPNWPSGWTPIPVHTVPHDEDYILEAHDICPKLTQLQVKRMERPEFMDFVASNWRILHTINVNSGNPPDYSFAAIAYMYQSLSIDKACNLTLPDWVTDDFYNDLQSAYCAGTDYAWGEEAFGLPVDKEMAKLSAGFVLNDWMKNIDDVINNATTVKYYAYSGHDAEMNSLMIGLRMKQELYGPDNTDYASTIACELWERDNQHFVKLLYSANIDSEFVPFTGKLDGCNNDLCLLADFKTAVQPLIASDSKICNM